MLTYTEIANWQRCTGVSLTSWEAEMLRKLSGAYLAEKDAAKAADRLMPEAEPED